MSKHFIKTHLIKSVLGACFFLAQSYFLNYHALARNQWEVQQHNQGAPQVMPYPASAINQSFYGNISSQFWSGQVDSFANNLAAGTILNGILETTLSSTKSQVGDQVIISLDAVSQNGLYLIPANSKISGIVTSVISAKSRRQGQAGAIDVSLQFIVFPDGSRIPFYGFIDNNPNHNFKTPSIVRNAGFDIADTGKQFLGSFASFTSGIGFVHAAQHRGNDFYLARGEQVNIKLNRSLQIPTSQIKNSSLPNQTISNMSNQSPTNSQSKPRTISDIPDAF